MISIAVTEERSIWTLDKVYQWKFPRKAWNDPLQVLLGIKLEYHSRYDEEHMRRCDDCYQAHLDLLADCEADARD